jgi:hypothetical protein
MRHGGHAPAHLFKLELLACGDRSDQFTYLASQP